MCVPVKEMGETFRKIIGRISDARIYTFFVIFISFFYNIILLSSTEELESASITWRNAWNRNGKSDNSSNLFSIFFLLQVFSLQRPKGFINCVNSGMKKNTVNRNNPVLPCS